MYSVLAGCVGASFVFYLLAMRLLEDESKSTFTAKHKSKPKVAQTTVAATPTVAPAAQSASAVLTSASAVLTSADAALAKALEGEAVTVAQTSAGIALSLRHERQFAPGSTAPAAQLRPLLQKIAAALDQTRGAIVVTGHADASPTRRFGSNQELAAARAQEVVRLMTPRLADPKRLLAEGKGETEPLAPNDTEADRARNRRVTFVLKPAP